MKIRIQDDSIRYRITLRELEHLAGDGRVSCETHVPGSWGGVFRYAVEAGGPDTVVSHIRLDAAAITLVLTPADMATLRHPEQEGVYLRYENHEQRRFIAFIEKDRPGSTCDKPEAWIYEMRPGAAPETRPIPAASVQ